MRCFYSPSALCRPPTRGVLRAPVVGLLVGLLAAAAGHAADVSVAVHGRDGAPVVDAAVILAPVGVAAAHRPARHSAQMDQLQRHFTPEVLVVETGTSVEFPNSDAVSHQVYSFSPAKRFQLPLYKGKPHAPVAFDVPGLIVLGCNIHDDMVGYIVVTDSPHHAQTDASGAAQISGVPAGRYQLSVWSPWIADNNGTLVKDLNVVSDAPVSASFRLKQALRHAPSPRPGRADWDSY